MRRKFEEYHANNKDLNDLKILIALKDSFFNHNHSYYIDVNCFYKSN
jgi:hypothetical protein